MSKFCKTIMTMDKAASPVQGDRMTSHALLCLGFGYTASHLSVLAEEAGWQVTGSHRRSAPTEKASFVWQPGNPLPSEALHKTTHLLLTIPPEEVGDPVFLHHAGDIAAMPNLRWLGYLSATSVYGDADGAWVDETTPPGPHDARGQRRLLAETQWLSLWRGKNIPVHIFRLAGIYGPGRNALVDMREGTARRLYKPGQVFSRVHVEDIASTLWHSIQHPAAGEVYNLSDDLPCASHEVVEYAARLLGMEPPPLIPVEEAEMSPMLHSFYAVSRRISNRKIKAELGVTLRYPDYRSALDAMLVTEQA